MKQEKMKFTSVLLFYANSDEQVSTHIMISDFEETKSKSRIYYNRDLIFKNCLWI